MSDDMPELTEAEFARMITRADRRRLTTLLATWQPVDLTALRKWLGLSEPQYRALNVLAKKKETKDG